MLRQGNVKLIGEPFPDLALNPAPGGGPSLSQGAPAAQSRCILGCVEARFIATAFNHQAAAAGNAAFARIYGFSFEGHYYDLPRARNHVGCTDRAARCQPGLPAALSQPRSARTDDAATRSWEFSGNCFNGTTIRRYPCRSAWRSTAVLSRKFLLARALGGLRDVWLRRLRLGRISVRAPTAPGRMARVRSGADAGRRQRLASGARCAVPATCDRILKSTPSTARGRRPIDGRFAHRRRYSRLNGAFS